MKKYILMMLSLMVAMPLARAGDRVTTDALYRQELKATQAAMEAKRKTLMAQNLMLTNAESGFWPVYDEYRRQMRKINSHLLDVISDYARTYRSGHINDKEAGEMLTKYLNALEKRIQLKKKFVRKFEKVLPRKKMVRFYQFDHRLDLLVQLELAKGVPLMQ